MTQRLQRRRDDWILLGLILGLAALLSLIAAKTDWHLLQPAISVSDTIPSSFTDSTEQVQR